MAGASATSYVVKAVIVYVLTFADILLNSVVDSNQLPSLGIVFPIIVLCIQVTIQLLNFLMMFVLFSGTYLFEVGLIGVLAKEFRPIFIVVPLYMLVYLAFMGCKLALLFGGGKSADTLWDVQLFVFFSITQKLVALVYYLFVFDTVTRIGEMQWYQKGPWVARYAAGQQHLLLNGGSRHDGGRPAGSDAAAVINASSAVAPQ